MGRKFDWVQVFVKDKAELEKRLPQALRALKPEGLLWLCFSKGTSKIQTDLTRDKGWESVEQAGLKWVAMIFAMHLAYSRRSWTSLPGLARGCSIRYGGAFRERRQS